MTKEEKLKNRHEESLIRLKNFCLMDDDFMTVCFENDIEGIQLVLRVILDEPDLVVTDVKTQYFMKNLQKRSVRLDVFATNSKGKQFNIEVQREDKGASSKRARYNSSLIDAKILEPGEDFERLPETYVIFITENDVLGGGRPLYHIDKCVLETQKIFGDGAHIIYVNGQYRGNNPLGRLMSDFHCTDAAQMYYNELKQRVRYFKETKEGSEKMCKVMEDAIERERADAKIEAQAEILAAMLESGMTLEKISEIVKMPVSEVERLIGELE